MVFRGLIGAYLTISDNIHLMFGTAPPFLKPLNGIAKIFADRNKHSMDASRIRADVERLPAPRNRVHFPESMNLADEIIIESFAAAGWATDKSLFRRKSGLTGANIIALKPGSESTDLIIVGAHHDTTDNSPGADDNTASVAALLELARLLQPYSFRHTILLATFDMEELNLIGSREFVRGIASEQKVRGAIVYETMSYSSSAPNSQKIPKGVAFIYPHQLAKIRKRDFRGDWTAVLYRQSALDMAKTFGAALDYTAGSETAILVRDVLDVAVIGRVFQRLPISSQLQRSDHLSFWQAGIPAILITDTANFRNPNYHRPTDTFDTLDYARAAEIVHATAVVVAEMAEWYFPEEP
jgi:Zn-dependent M28 family amino/carboxypeptidase